MKGGESGWGRERWGDDDSSQVKEGGSGKLCKRKEEKKEYDQTNIPIKVRDRINRKRKSGGRLWSLRPFFNLRKMHGQKWPLEKRGNNREKFFCLSMLKSVFSKNAGGDEEKQEMDGEKVSSFFVSHKKLQFAKIFKTAKALSETLIFILGNKNAGYFCFVSSLRVRYFYYWIKTDGFKLFFSLFCLCLCK